MRTRNYDPEVARLSGLLGPMIRDDRPEDEVDQVRRELADARILAAAKDVAAKLHELPPEKREYARALLAGA